MRLTGLARGVLVAATACAVAGCGSSSSTGTPSTSAAVPVSTPAVTTTTATTVGAGLVGTWHADVRDLLAGTAALSHGVSFDCSGPVTLTFSAAGTGTDHLQIRCTIQGQVATGDITSTANYRVNGSHVSFSNVHNTGGIQVMGISVPFPATFSSSGADITITGDQLRVAISAAGTTIHQVYHRG